MLVPLAPAHLMALAAFQLAAVLLFLDPRLAAALLLLVAPCMPLPMFLRLRLYLPIVSRSRKGAAGVAFNLLKSWLYRGMFLEVVARRRSES
jgi:hypothetical protein